MQAAVPPAIVPIQPSSLQLELPQGVTTEVVLSSMENVGHFWLQIPTHPTYAYLPTLDFNMVSVYSQGTAPSFETVHIGAICAVPLVTETFTGWYRAVVVEVFAQENLCRVKFVDYGGYATVAISRLRQIRVDFMQLPFQAVEVHLANVVPLDGKLMPHDGSLH